MTVESFHKLDARSVKLARSILVEEQVVVALLRDAFVWQVDPGVLAFKIGLDIGLLGISLLNVMPWDGAIGISSFAGFH